MGAIYNWAGVSIILSDLRTTLTLGTNWQFLYCFYPAQHQRHTQQNQTLVWTWITATCNSKSLNSSYGYSHLPGKFLEGSAWGSCLKDSIYTDNNLYSGWNAECSHVMAMLNPPDTLGIWIGIWAKEGSCTNKAFWLNQCPPRCCITHARPVDSSANHILWHLHIVYSYFHVQNNWKHPALHVYNNGCGSICEKLHSWAPLFLLLLSSFRHSSANRQP